MDDRWHGEGTGTRAELVNVLRELVPAADLEQLKRTADEMYDAIGPIVRGMVVAALADERRKMREHLEVYGAHLHTCPWDKPGWACTCGLDAALGAGEGRDG